jgi:hypothetical protein
MKKIYLGLACITVVCGAIIYTHDVKTLTPAYAFLCIVGGSSAGLATLLALLDSPNWRSGK